MTLNPLRLRDPVVVPARPDLSRKDKVAIWSRENGICPGCLKPVAMEGLGVQYDHFVPRELSADDSLGNLYAMHPACHAEKTTGDRKVIAKTHRQAKLGAAKEHKRGGFRRDPNFKRTVDGRVVPR